MPKVPPATLDDLNGVRNELAGVSAKADKAEVALQKLTAENAKLQKELSDLQATAKKLATLEGLERVAQDSNTRVEKAEHDLGSQLKQTGETLQVLKEAEGALETKLSSVDTAWRSALADELTRLGDDIGKELETMRTELSTQAEKWFMQAAEAVVDQKKVLDAAIEETKADGAKSDQYIAKQAAAELDTLKAELEERAKKQNERDARQEAAIYEALEKLGFDVKESAMSTMNQSSQRTDEVASDLDTFRTDAQQRIETMEGEFKMFKDAVAEVENLSTRRVDWIIKNASRRLKEATDKASLHTSWFSPKFNAAGMEGLQLEFQLYRKADPPVEDELAGDCAVFLWASRGANLVYRLHIGSKNQTLEKVFNGRVPYGTKRLCFLKDQVNKENDTLRVSVEILEAIREVEHNVAATSEAEEKANPFAARALESVVQYRRHVNNRLFDQVKQQVDIMQSRMVRKVEWRLEQASALKRCFPAGEPICSTTFNAAGIEGMQLVFYPSGYSGSTEGFCSLFLFAPAGVTLRCSLWAGGQRRDANHTFEDAGAFGRTNFCRLETAMDEETDSVLLALDIEEAHQDVQATMAYPSLQPGDRRTQSELEGSLPKSVNSVVKLSRVPGKVPPGMDATCLLPSLWTSKSLGDTLAPADGLHSFDELAGKKGGGRGRNFAATVGDTSTTLSRRSESVPTLGSVDRSPMQSATIPLPQLAKANRMGVGPEAFGASLGGKPRKQRLY